MLTDGRRTDGRTPDACIYYKLTYEPTAQVSQQYIKMIAPTKLRDKKFEANETINIFIKDNPRMNGSECCNMSLQKKFKI